MVVGVKKMRGRVRESALVNQVTCARHYLGVIRTGNIFPRMPSRDLANQDRKSIPTTPERIKQEGGSYLGLYLHHEDKRLRYQVGAGKRSCGIGADDGLLQRVQVDSPTDTRQETTLQETPPRSRQSLPLRIEL